MYEFTDKKIKEKFKETEYGKKTHKMFLVASLILCVLLVICTILYILNEKEVIYIKDELVNVGKYLLFIVAILACYFDGKRDGAIEMYKSKKKK